MFIPQLVTANYLCLNGFCFGLRAHNTHRRCGENTIHLAFESNKKTCCDSSPHLTNPDAAREMRKWIDIRLDSRMSISRSMRWRLLDAWCDCIVLYSKTIATDLISKIEQRLLVLTFHIPFECNTQFQVYGVIEDDWRCGHWSSGSHMKIRFMNSDPPIEVVR